MTQLNYGPIAARS